MQANEAPPIITELVGCTCTFQFKLSTFNFTPKHQSFTISRIFTERGGTPTTNMHEPTSLASTSAEVGNNNAKETSSVKVAALGELPYVDVSKTDNPKLKINEPRKPGQPY
ncbi:PREDICTED: uncharacterized protein LOC106299002 [Brassica oleracea var. oleracea]|uniref:uncharacterized protein LOC106299002 n=1 Tax=Brassica oleracea var. oleracea TaxID=109376 RepID=UPI0006A6D045|nr:PREDICTED: uncharacterized protein LOC106299002 [Brassica oleracea var. oleracea]